LTSRPARQKQVPPVVRELDQVSQDLLALASHLTRLAAAIEQAGATHIKR
jgi:hypothetical protein